MAALQEVPVASLSPERFESLLGQGWKQVDEAIDEARRLLKGRVVWNVNSTARGGGVAELLQSLLAYARGAGVDVRWLTISGNPDFFRVTKRIHNRLHESEGDGGPLGPEEREVYESALAEAADELVQLVQPGDIVDIHDPQPAGLLPHVVSADVKVIWRCHIGVDRPGELARGAWDFMRRYIEDADAYIFSRKPFVWDGLDQNRIWIIPPSIDAFSPKNEELSPEAVGGILAAIGLQDTADPGHALFQRFDGTESRVTRPADLTQDGPLPEDAPVVCQVSRWDRLKDPVGVQRSFAEFVESEAAHLVLAGPSVAGVSDDPEGLEVLEEVTARRGELPAEKRSRVHLISLPTDDIEENAAMVNAIQRRSTVVLQKSLAEGFGLTVAEAMWKSRPMVASRVGGIQDQIEDGVSGVLIDDPTDLLAVAQAVDGFIDDPARAAEVGKAARERVLEDFLGTRTLLQYMDLIETLLAPESA
ncbi:MAG TPA: glycosyltransferase [Solirubrobacterales bacterium]|nr:glycosyltransferase [Solirubrobacterales bacterium]